MAEPQPFRPQLFLFRMLAGIFIVEALFLGFAFWKCSLPIGGQPVPMLADRCPKLGSRSQELFGVAVATVLSLLGGAALANRQPSSGAPGEASLPAPPQLPPEGARSPGRARKSQRPEPPEEG